MQPTGYKLLGYLVWNAGKWYLRRKYLNKLPSRKAKRSGILALCALTLAAIALLARKASQ